MHKRPTRHRRLLLDKEIIKILTATANVDGGKRPPYSPSMPPEGCNYTSQTQNEC